VSAAAENDILSYDKKNPCGEHEVSLQSGASVIANLDRDKFEVIPVSVDKEGRWQWNDLKLIEESRAKSLPIFPYAPEMRLRPQADGRAALEPIQAGTKSLADIDVIFPVMHGPLCEDGAVQGLLELADVAYVGSGILGSAIGMDKEVAKRLAHSAGIPIVPYVGVTKPNFIRDPSDAEKKARASLKLPVFVKPANMGSSVGVHKVKKWEDLRAALEDSFQYDLKVLIEEGIDAREIEVAVLETVNGAPFVSVPSEIRAAGKHEFYSYEAKYLDPNGATIDLPAKIDANQVATVQKYAAEVFEILECGGMARADFFLDRVTNKFYFNEVNTIPGFTTISMYPKMMGASGVSYKDLLSRLVTLALHRQQQRHSLKRDFSSK
jgi:D-alanine-D-alanine ligase